MTASANPSATTLPSISISAQRKRKNQPSRQRDARGDRYQIAGAYAPGVGVARSARRAAVETTLGAVADPFEPGKRIQASLNRRVDVLEYERANGWITVSQYETGRQVQAVFEKASGARNTSESDFGDVRISDPSRRPETLDIDFIRAISNAREVEALMRRIHQAIGETPAHFLREILSRAGTIKDYVRGKDQLASDREVTKAATKFRWMLEVLDEAFAARGLVQRDADGNPLIRAERGEATGEETDERGRMVRAGRGYRWGRIAGAQDVEA